MTAQFPHAQEIMEEQHYYEIIAFLTQFGNRGPQGFKRLVNSAVQPGVKHCLV